MAEQNQWKTLADMMHSAVKMTNVATDFFAVLAKGCEFRIVVKGRNYAPDGEDVDCCRNMEHRDNAYRESWDKHSFCRMLDCPFVSQAAMEKIKGDS